MQVYDVTAHSYVAVYKYETHNSTVTLRLLVGEYLSSVCTFEWFIGLSLHVRLTIKPCIKRH